MSQQIDYRDKIVEEFEKMRRREYANGERFKVRAYMKAIEAIQELGQAGRAITSINDVKGVKNIGKKSLEKIEEIIRTGQLQATRAAEADPRINAINLFAQIHGIGIVKARELVIENGILDISQLRGRQDLLSNVQKIGLTYYEDLIQRIPCTEMQEHDAFLKSQYHGGLIGTIAGSYRRQTPDSGDIDLLITEKENNVNAFNQFLERLTANGYLVAKLSQGPLKFNGICRLRGTGRLYRRIDILFTSPTEYPFALLYFTGSKLFNTEMRQMAHELGYSLNEKDLTLVKTETPVQHSFQSEEDIFRFLQLEYVPPVNRKSGVIRRYNTISQPISQPHISQPPISSLEPVPTIVPQKKIILIRRK